VVVGHGAVSGPGGIMQVISGGECLIELAVEVGEVIVAGASSLEVDEGGEAAMGFGGEILMLKALEAENEKRGSAEERHRKRGLQDDKCTLESADVAGSAVGTVEGVGGVEP